MLGSIVAALFIAFITGALARFALPGPDPMPPWLTLAIGLLGFIGGEALVLAIGGRNALSWSGLASFGIAVCLVIAYRRFVQKRPVWGKEAYRFPKRGFGVEHYRERLRNVGIDPDQIGAGGTPFGNVQPGAAVPRPAAPASDHPGKPTENPAHYLGLLEELHDSGVLDDAEYDGARLRLLEQLRQ
jgi:uncharacterized membrane protein YeaQ/YmgE (transglycosylase-associated protein family)